MDELTIEQKAYLTKVYIALNKIKDAHKILGQLWDTDHVHGIDLNDFLAKEYPAGWPSFDDQDIDGWVKSSQEALEKRISNKA